MTRRAFAMIVMSLPLLRAFKHKSTYGYMDVERWYREGHFGKHTFCNGEDITNRCSWFNDETGEAGCYIHDANGQAVVDPSTGEAAMEILRGRIEVARIEVRG